jgi:hypothetical protein
VAWAKRRVPRRWRRARSCWLTPCFRFHDDCCALQAEKLSSLGGLGKEKSAKTLAESEKLLADTVKHCEDMVAGASTALEGMRSR